MNEVKQPEIQETKKAEPENFKEIKPEKETTVEKANEYWDSKFNSLENTEAVQNPGQETIDGKEHYFDDNGELYRVDKELLPESEYTINGYEYKTDDIGRIVSAEGKLHLKNHEGRLDIKDSKSDIGKGDEKETDDRGHLIGDRFDGSNGLENMVPQDSKINKGEFNQFENQLAKEVSAGNDVRVKIEPIYSGESRRPDAIGVTYSINGETSMRIFPNGKE